MAKTSMKKAVKVAAESPVPAAPPADHQMVLVEDVTGAASEVVVDLPYSERQRVVQIGGVPHQHVADAADGRWIYRRM